MKKMTKVVHPQKVGVKRAKMFSESHFWKQWVTDDRLTKKHTKFHFHISAHSFSCPMCQIHTKWHDRTTNEQRGMTLWFGFSWDKTSTEIVSTLCWQGGLQDSHSFDHILNWRQKRTDECPNLIGLRVFFCTSTDQFKPPSRAQRTHALPQFGNCSCTSWAGCWFPLNGIWCCHFPGNYCRQIWRCCHRREMSPVTCVMSMRCLHCCSVICNFTWDTNEQVTESIQDELHSVMHCRSTSGSN